MPVLRVFDRNSLPEPILEQVSKWFELTVSFSNTCCYTKVKEPILLYLSSNSRRPKRYIYTFSQDMYLFDFRPS